YISSNKLSDDELGSIVIQILMSLITFQKTFGLTHNDLHTNNVMYNKTDKKFIYYCYKKKHYKVPTFGRIFKIIDPILSTIESRFDGLKIVVDCANGAAYHTAPPVFHELGAEVIAIGVEPNGKNINDHCGATAPAALIAKVKEVNADIGIALDGDADRLQMVDQSGRLFNGDELLYILAKDRLEQGKVMGGVVGTLMTNLAIEVAIKNLGLGFERAKVGDRYVLELLQAKQWVIGGEGSGHLLCLDQHSTGDGTIAALQVLAAMQQKQQSLNELLDGITIYPQVLINVKTNANYQWQADHKLNAMVSKVEESLIGKGRVLIRPSGTEPVLRIMVEANQQSLAQASAEAIAREVSVL
ncbi:MAG: hypothetical protein EBX94_08240, partial [Burkholderiaceae bacterium]|nr:hypothetical protein [Burkholderiaceae bacterium]